MELDLDTFVGLVHGTRIVSYMNAVCATLLCYDFFEYLDREVEIIWMTKWTMTKFMYILTRYSAFVEAAVVLYQISIPGDWYDECALAFKMNACLFVFGLGVGEVIMTTRTWAVWKKNRFLMYFLPGFYIAIWASGFAVTGIFLKSVEFEPTPLNAYVGCYATYTSPIIFVSWLLLLFYDFVMFILMVVPAYKAYRMGGMSRLMVLVFRDGIVYYLYLFGLSLLNIICTLTFPPSLILVFSLLSRVLHAILACRTVLNLHELGRPILDEHQQRNIGSTLPIRTHPKQFQTTHTAFSTTYSQIQSTTMAQVSFSTPTPKTNVVYDIQKPLPPAPKE